MKKKHTIGFAVTLSRRKCEVRIVHQEVEVTVEAATFGEAMDAARALLASPEVDSLPWVDRRAEVLGTEPDIAQITRAEDTEEFPIEEQNP